jgi:hypothetical protein
MNNPLTYPLEQLVSIKKNRFDQAVKILEEKKALLDKANAKLYALTEERDEVLKHKNAKLTQFRTEVDGGTTTGKIQQMKTYLKLVEEQLATKQKNVADQQKVVDAAKKQVDMATEEVIQRKKDLEKLEIHKKEWEKEVRYLTEQKEGLELDDQGSATHALRKKEEQRRNTKRESHEQ